MKSEWARVKLKEILTIKYGKSQKKVENPNGKYPIYGTGGIIGYADNFLYDKPSILIGRKGSIKEVKYVDKPFWTIDTLFYTKINNEKVIPAFLFYELSLIDFTLYNEGTSIPSLTTKTLNRLEIPLPPLPTQKVIADTLSALDDKIELNNRINQNLEAQAQALFKHWFVDFEFPDENGKPYKSSGGKMVESELGLIPEGWRVGIVGEFGEIITGKTPSTKKEENYGDNVPFITIPDMHNKTFITSTERYLSKSGEQTQKNKTLPPCSVLVSCIASPGLVVINTETSQTNQQINSIVCNNYSFILVFLTLKTLSNQIKLFGSGGTTTNNLNKTQFSNLRVIIPDKTIENEFHYILSPLFDSMKKRQQQNQTFAQIRDTLLPKLMSGEIEVPIN